MEAIPSTLHGRPKFEFQGEVHTILGDPKSYALCNMDEFKNFAIIPPQFEIEPL